MARKSYFTISEIAKEFKVKKGHIRSYEQKGLISPRNNKLGRRIYNQHDRARLELIFHFEHADYSLDQISELIGIPDGNLDKMEQFIKSLKYGEKKLDELEKRSKEIKFPDIISVMNEINMMRKYVEKLKNIEPLKWVTEKKLKRKHIRMIPVYIGLSLILIIAGYFFYQGGKTLNFTQKKPPKTEASPEYRYPVPPNDTGDQQNVASQPSETPDSPLPIQGDSFIEESKELVNKEPIIDKAETVIPNKTTPSIGVEKVPLLSTESTDATIGVEGSAFSPEQTDLKVLKEKALLKESEPVKKLEEENLTQRTEACPILKADPSLSKITPTVPPEPSNSQLETKKLIDKKLSSIRETGRTENEDIAIKLKQLDSNVTIDLLIPSGTYIDDTMTKGEVVKIRTKKATSFYETLLKPIADLIPVRYRYVADFIGFLFWAFLFMTFFRVFTFMGYGRALRGSLFLGGLVYFFMPDFSPARIDDIFIGTLLSIIILRAYISWKRKKNRDRVDVI